MSTNNNHHLHNDNIDMFNKVKHKLKTELFKFILNYLYIVIGFAISENNV